MRMLTDEWYEAPPVKWGRHSYFVARARSPWVRGVMLPGLIGDHCRFMLRLAVKHDRPGVWPLWRIEPPALDHRFVELSPVDVALGWALTVWALWYARGAGHGRADPARGHHPRSRVG